MKLATIRVADGLRAVRVEGDEAIETGHDDVGALLREPDWRESAAGADGRRHDVGRLDFAPVVPNPGKVFCVGLNYRDHIVETGKPMPEFPDLFAKFASTLIGCHDPIAVPKVSTMLDFEAELTVVIGSSLRYGDRDAAVDAIAGYTIMNDVSVRDYQRRTPNVTQGKVWEATAPVGPYLVTEDELPPGGSGLAISSAINGESMQHSTTDQLLFDAVTLVAYISDIVTLEPGDLIATGTPGGVGSMRRPPRWLRPGDELVTTIAGLGECRNPIT